MVLHFVVGVMRSVHYIGQLNIRAIFIFLLNPLIIKTD